ncbi:MAG: alpha-L-arabinofuranosidase C-terminal domain-containing protein [Bacteroidota bacterium]|nr:alpha-L-arabinofuranosidase C-terminal domain-containing protein [Bacteroidota bacterium]
MLTSCDFWHHDKPDTLVEIDLTGRGMTLPKDMYGAYVKDINSVVVNKSKPGTGTLNAALDVATCLMELESNADTVKKTANGSESGNLHKWIINQGMVVSNHGQTYKTPSYYAVNMFSENKPDRVMPAKVTYLSSNLREDSTARLMQKEKNQSGVGIGTRRSSIYATAGIHEKQGLVIIKIVNAFNNPHEIKIVLNQKKQIKYKGEVTVLASKSIMDENSYRTPENVVPMTRELNGLKNTFYYKCPANSIVIINVRYKKGINGTGNCC